MRGTFRSHAPFKHQLLLFLAILLTGKLSAAQEAFQYIGATGTQTWEVAGNWTGGSGSFSSYPGEAPQVSTLDSANLVGSRSEDLNLVINADIELEDLTLGSSELAFVNNIVSGSPGTLLTVDEIFSSGTVLSVNHVDVDLRLNKDLDIRGTNALTVNGDLINDNPNPASFRKIINHTQLVDFKGSIVLSNDATNAGHVFFQNAGSLTTRISGVISDGSSAGGKVTYARGDFDIRSDSTYTGTTLIGANDPETASMHTIHTDQPFGLSRVNITGGTSVKTIRPAAGKGTRTLANDFQLSRELVFAGVEDIVLNGTVSQSNSTVLTNNISSSAMKALIINGDIYAADSNNIRPWRFEGSGRTVVNGIIDDSLGHPGVTGATLVVDVTGRVILTNPAVAAYGGNTQVSGGVLQLGNGGPAVNLNDQDVTGDSTLEINHSTAMTLAPRLTGTVDLQHTGPGVTTLDRISIGGGSVLISAGTLLVNAGDGVTSGTGTRSVTVAGGTLGGTGHVGGMVTASAGGTIAPGSSVGTLSFAGFTLASGATLEIELGDVPSSEFDNLTVLNDLTLGGTLSILPLPSISISPGMSFKIIDLGGTRTGEFAGLADGALVGNFGGVDLFIDYDAGDGNDIALFTAGLPGDFDGNQRVDGFDFLAWQRNPALGDLTDWETNYGQTLSENSAAVPEPGALGLVLAAFCLSACRRR